MGIIVLLILISLSIAILFLVIFYWSIKSGQFEDTYTPSVRILFEEKGKTAKRENGNLVDSAPQENKAQEKK